jgi:cytosine/adenosine deaminase-related metal-dependent hydrolase
MSVLWPARPIVFVNAKVVTPETIATSLTVGRGRIVAVGEPPGRRDLVVDLEGAIVCPGFVNAHDHLELNSFPRLKWRDRHVNVREWIADFQPRFATDGALAPARPDTLADRVWVGGLKNLLGGVTTVCHHNPLHRPIRRRFPVRVVRRFGFSHSLLIDGPAVASVHRETPAGWPWVIHAAEGVDAEAENEIELLERLGCLGPRTVIVHGVGISAAQQARLIERGTSLVWCPSSNEFLFGRTAAVGAFARARRLALGTDSRLSGAGDLFDELRAAAATGQVDARGLVRAITVDAAAVLRLPAAGRLTPGVPADLTVLSPRSDDPWQSITNSRRTDVRLTMVDGRPLVADPALAEVFTVCRTAESRVVVDGVERLMAVWIARRAAALRLREPGLELVA